MPFLVATKRPCPACVHGPAAGGEHRPEFVSRRAVATLEEAQKWAHGGMDMFYDAALAITESGGSVGPLPDGTLIDVESIGLARLRIDCGAPEGHMDVAEILAAYNAKQAAA